MLKENKLKKVADKVNVQEFDKKDNIDDKEDTKRLHRKLLNDFNSQFQRNLGADQQVLELDQDTAQKAVSFDKRALKDMNKVST